MLLDPFERRATERLGFAAWDSTNEKFKPDSFFRIGMGETLEWFADDNFHTQFFPQFANETLSQSFSWFTFAARKFPQPTEMRVGMTLRDQQPTLAKNQSGSNVNDGIVH